MEKEIWNGLGGVIGHARLQIVRTVGSGYVSETESSNGWMGIMAELINLQESLQALWDDSGWDQKVSVLEIAVVLNQYSGAILTAALDKIHHLPDDAAHKKKLVDGLWGSIMLICAMAIKLDVDLDLQTHRREELGDWLDIVDSGRE